MFLPLRFITFLGIAFVSAYSFTVPVQITKNQSVKKWCSSLGRASSYGNWCGPCHTGKSPSTRCIDRLDCACRAHDLCYRRYFTDYCQCDVNFVNSLMTIRGSRATWYRRLFKLKRCKIRACLKKTCYGFSCKNLRRCGSNKVCTLLRIPRSSNARNKC